MQASIIRGHRDARGFAPLALSAADVKHYAALAGVGINLNDRTTRQMMAGLGLDMAMDSNDVGIAPAPLSGLTTASIATPTQFLQAWLPGFVRVLTAARKIDELIGLTTVGSFEDEEVVQGVLEPTGVAIPYTDDGNVPLMNWNTNFERRTVVRFEAGMSVGVLEELRVARMRVNTAGEKRASAALALDIQRNRVGFYGFNSGSNRTYGFLNDPALPAYVNFPNGAGGSALWSSKTFLEIQKDIRLGLVKLRTQSMDTIDPGKTPITIAVPTNAIDFLSVTSDFGISVQKWLDDAYPNVRVVSAPELNDANGGVGVAYFFAERVDDGASDDSKVFGQNVPSKFFTLGVEKRTKSYVEDYANASAGTMCKRPYAVARYSGLS